MNRKCFLFLSAVFAVAGVADAQTRVTVDATTHRHIGGVGELDRARYFNHWGHHVIEGPTNLGDLRRQVWAADGLHSITGRDTWEFDAIAQQVREDPDVWHPIAVPATGANGYDDADHWLFSRTINVPLAWLVDGDNEVFVDFDTDGGQLVTATLLVTKQLEADPG